MSSMIPPMKNSFTRYPMQKIFNAPSHVSILRVLNQLTQGISGRELARRAGINDRTCRLSLQRLEQLNLVVNLGTGKTKLFKLNRKHYFNQYALSSLFTKEYEYLPALIEKLKEELSKNCVWACIYGSVAQNTDYETSDLDVLIVVKDEENIPLLEDKIATWSADIYMHYGLSFAPVILTTDQWKHSKQFRELKKNIIQSNIPLIGHVT